MNLFLDYAIRKINFFSVFLQFLFKENQKHPFHLVDPSPWALVAAFGALALTFGGVLYMHNFSGGGFLLLTGVFTVLFVMYAWFKDIIREGTFEGQHTKTVQVGLRWGMLLCSVVFLQIRYIFISVFFRKKLLLCFFFNKGILKSLLRIFNMHRITKLRHKFYFAFFGVIKRMKSICVFFKRIGKFGVLANSQDIWDCFFMQRAIISRFHFVINIRKSSVLQYCSFGAFSFEKTKRQSGMRFLTGKPIIRGSMSTAELLTSLEKQNKNKFYINKGLINLIADTRILILAYKVIKSNTAGFRSHKEAIQMFGNIDIRWFENISTIIRDGTFRFMPKERLLVSNQASSDSRSLMLSYFSDRIVQCAIRIVFESVFENSFLDSSHGYRPGKGCHTALQKVTELFENINWAIESNLSRCFTVIDYRVLLNIIKKKIVCEKTLSLIRFLLKTVRVVFLSVLLNSGLNYFF